jgi:hypothetical protein
VHLGWQAGRDKYSVITHFHFSFRCKSAGGVLWQTSIPARFCSPHGLSGAVNVFELMFNENMALLPALSIEKARAQCEHFVHDVHAVLRFC